MMFLQLIINGKLFSVCEIYGIFSGMSTPKQAPPLFPHCTENTKLTSLPRYVLNRDFLRNVPPQIQLVPFATNKQKMDH